MNNKVTLSEDNVFADLGLEDSEEMRARSDLLSELTRIVRTGKLLNKEVAAILEISPPKVSALMSGKINEFSTDTLMNYLTKLGCTVEIRVLSCPKPLSKSTQKGRMSVKRRPSLEKRDSRNRRRKSTVEV
ncbi:MAG: XRE family transcriptional regulator [Verrucomicrobiota bacterium]|nr:XRE family transcriptional regulator [Verrucomicrobiota bacterium]